MMEEEQSLTTTFAQLLKRTKEDAKKMDNPAVLGVIQGNSVIVDGFDIPIPLSDFGVLQHWQYTYSQSPSFEKPRYKNGDRVLLVPTSDSHYVIVGKVG